MDFALTEEQSAIFDTARDVGRDRIAPHARAWEADGEIPKDLWPDLARLGFTGLYVTEDDGGSGLSRLDTTLVFEALSMACPSVAAFLSVHNLSTWMVSEWGTQSLKDRVLARAVAGDAYVGYCLTEPGSGSDAAALETRAARTNEGWKLTGTKAFISGGGYAEAYVVMCRTGEDGPKGISAIVLENGTPGLSFGGLEEKMGWRSQPTRQVRMDDAKAPADALLGEEGQGFTYAMKGLDGGRLNIAACSLGAAQIALNKTVDYMGERKAFGETIDQFQALRFRLADMEISLQAARTFLRQAAWKLDKDAPDATKFCAMAKKFVTETGSKIVNDCLQLHGGYGYLADYGIEKLVRDLRVHEILEGSNEIMRMIVARQMLATR